MQSDKLPTMPIGTPFPFRAPEDDESSDLRWTILYAAQQMRDYALAARKAAIEEAAQLCDAKVAQLKKLGAQQNQIGTAQILGESIRALGGDA